MRSAISALAGLALAGSFAFAQPSDGRLTQQDGISIGFAEASIAGRFCQIASANRLERRIRSRGI